MKPLRIPLLLAVGSAALSVLPGLSAGQVSRIYPYVQRMDTATGTWRSIPAKARLTVDARKLSLTIWNEWGEEAVNPLLRVVSEDIPQKDTLTGKWRRKATLFRTKDTGKECTIESCTIIAITEHSDFTIVGSGYSARYRIGRKAFEKP